MTVNKYPVFKPGQTLNAEELNLLADHTWNRDQLVGRMTGFGINAGLGGSFSGSTLTIAPGLAVDQRGEPLVSRDPLTKVFTTPVDTSPRNFPFVGTHADSWSVVLRATDVPDTIVACTENDCAGHSEKHTRGVEIVVVAGRITGPRFDFATLPIHAIDPLLLSTTGQPIGNLATFKTNLTAALSSLNPSIAGPLIAKVNAVTIPAAELPGVKGYKVGWLNTVLFATIDLLRCQALHSVQTFRDDTEPGVVLGEVTHSGSTWTFTCSYKHFWEPPKGLSQSLLGGTCGSVCSTSQDYLESVLDNYAPPDPPPAPTPPTGGGGGVIIDPPLVYCPHGRPDCGIILWPGKNWRERVPIPRPGEEIILDFLDDYDLSRDPGTRVQEVMTDAFIKTPVNALGNGVLVADSLIGHFGVNVKATIEKNVRDHGGNPTVTLVTSDELEGIEHLEHGTTFGISDHVIVTVDSNGLAIGMGFVPAMVAVRQAGPIALAAQKAIDDAGASLEKLEGFETKFDTGMKEVSGSLKLMQETVGGFQGQIDNVKGTNLDHAVLTQRVSVLETQGVKVDTVLERVSRLEGRALSQVGDLGIKTYTTDVGNTMAEFAQTATKALRSIDSPRNANLHKYIDEVEIKQGELEIAVRAGDPEAVAGATVELLDSMRTMIGGAGVEAGAKRQLDAQFRAMKGLLG